MIMYIVLSGFFLFKSFPLLPFHSAHFARLRCFLRCSCRLYVFLPWILVLAVFGVRVRFWLFRGLAACFTVVCLFYAAVCALCAWVSLFFVFYLSFYRCLAVAGFAFVVCGGFCALSSFWRRFAFLHFCVFVVVFFAPIFLHCWCPFLYFFLSLNVVCWRFVFLHFRIINRIFSRLGGLFYVICLSLPLITHFLCFFWRFFVRFESCLPFFRIVCWVLHGLAACFA